MRQSKHVNMVCERIVFTLCPKHTIDIILTIYPQSLDNPSRKSPQKTASG
jgi:hypothetical protein